MSGVTAIYGTPPDFITFFRYFHTSLTTIHVLSIVSSPFTNCVSNQNTEFDMLTCQM